ncbi:hypothetical protein KCP74_11985 [Salmonella enterica subsp. enterica]|nr:hypothetical protein KCP74_11985 [Salmonella enterica subsp. enterica]
MLVSGATDRHHQETVYGIRGRFSSAVNFEPLSALESKLYRDTRRQRWKKSREQTLRASRRSATRAGGMLHGLQVLEPRNCPQNQTQNITPLSGTGAQRSHQRDFRSGFRQNRSVNRHRAAPSWRAGRSAAGAA